MGVQSQSALIAAVLLMALAINVAFAERRIEHRRSFTALLAAVFAYNLTLFVYTVSDQSLFWMRMILLSGVGVAQACLLFFGRVLHTTYGRTARTVIHVGSALAVALTLTELAEGVPLRAGVGLLAVGTYAGCIWHLFSRYRAADNPVEATRLGYLVLGGVISVLTSAADLLPAAGITFPSLGHLFTTVYLYFWAQVIQRSRLLDLKELLGRGLALILLSIIVTAIYVTLLTWVDIGEELGLFFFNALAASVVVFFVFEPLKRVVDVWVGRLLFHETRQLEDELRRLRRALANVVDIAELAELVAERLRASRRVTEAGVYFLESGGRGYAVPGLAGARRLDVVQDRAFLDVLTRERVLAIEQLERELMDLDAADDSAERARLAAMVKTMNGISAGVALALGGETRLVGLLAVRDDRTREAFSTYELGLFSDLAAQMTIAVENSEIVQRLKERDRLSAVGEMATGMAHEIRNPLGAIKSAAQLLDPGEVDPESREFIEVIIEEADRLDHVLRQFLDFARPYRGELMPMHVGRIVDRVAMLMRAEEHAGPVEVDVEVDEDLPSVIGDAAQIHQVCLNLARNACQAMDTAGGTLTLGAAVVTEEVPGRPGTRRERVEVSVRDTGPGIGPEVRANLFIPFFTTKRRGTGLGLPISQRLLVHHGSEVRVDSTPGQGTTMRFRLFLEQEADQLTGEQRRLLTMPRASIDLQPELH